MSDDTFEIPRGAVFDVTEEGIVLGNKSNVVIHGSMGRKIAKIYSEEGSVNLELPPEEQCEVKGIEATNGKVTLSGNIKANSIKAESVDFTEGKLQAKSVISQTKINMGGAEINSYFLMAPEVQFSQETRGRAMIVECQNEIGPSRVKGCFGLDEYMELQPGVQQVLQNELATIRHRVAFQPNGAAPETEAYLPPLRPASAPSAPTEASQPTYETTSQPVEPTPPPTASMESPAPPPVQEEPPPPPPNWPVTPADPTQESSMTEPAVDSPIQTLSYSPDAPSEENQPEETSTAPWWNTGGSSEEPETQASESQTIPDDAVLPDVEEGSEEIADPPPTQPEEDALQAQTDSEGHADLSQEDEDEVKVVGTAEDIANLGESYGAASQQDTQEPPAVETDSDSEASDEEDGTHQQLLGIADEIVACYGDAPPEVTLKIREFIQTREYGKLYNQISTLFSQVRSHHMDKDENVPEEVTRNFQRISEILALTLIT